MNLTRKILAVSIYLLISCSLSSAPLFFEPRNVNLPDGRTLSLYISGDEFFNWMHDTLGYPVKKGGDGYYYYMLQNDSIFSYTNHRAGDYDPLSITNIKPVVIPSNVSRKREEFYKTLEAEDRKNNFSFDSKYSGVYNNLVIYIKFSDQSNFTTTRTTYDNRFNSLTSSSVRHYYREISYDKVDMISYHMPGGPTENLCYTDIYPRDYFRPYDVATNPQGYSTSSEKTSREHNLLARVVKYINDNYQAPDGVNFDMNNDGRFDNVAFIIKGSADGWSDLLWPHRWSLYSLTANLWGKRVYGYTFQLENVSVKTFTHEMFHALGAPDLYHYTRDGISPAGPWDLMHSGGGHPTAWMKSRYGGWISSIPEITQSGTYSLLPLTSPEKNSFKIASPYSSDEFVVLEFRKKTGIYENTLPSNGIIISRIDRRYRGNAQGPPDEVYIFRPGGTLTANGTVNSATFSDLYGRTAFNDNTNPSAFLQDGSEAGIYISDIKYYTDSMTFRVDVDMPRNLIISQNSDDALGLNWSGTGTKPFMIAVSTTDEPLNPGVSSAYSPGDRIGTNGTVIYKGTGTSFLHTGLVSDEPYYYTIWSITDETDGIYSSPLKGSERTGIHNVISLPWTEDFSTATFSELPRGWKAGAGADQWELSSINSLSGSNAILIRDPGPQSNWFYTPGINLSSQSKYLITFRYKSSDPASREYIAFYGGTERHNNGLLQHNIYSDSYVQYNDYVIARAVFKPAESETHYFGIKTQIYGKGILFEDFRMEKVPARTLNLSDPASFYPNPSTGKIVVPASERTDITIFLPGGTAVFTKTIEGTTELDLSQLKAGIYIIRFSNNTAVTSSRLVIVSQLP
ncbi:MAG: M6 family metalloprotease domain-containing protein [Bacteroidales bacterium]